MSAIPAVLIFSGNNQRAVVAFCRFAVSNNIEFFIVARNESDTILLTHYKSNLIGVRKNNEFTIEEFRDYTNIIKKNLVILPSTEFLNRYLIENRNPLEAMGYIIPLCSKFLYEQISDKLSFGELCKQHAMTVPGELDTISSFSSPMVAKPKKYLTTSGSIFTPQLILSESDYSAFLEKYDATDFYFQEFIYGRSFYLLYHFSKDNSHAVYSQENLVQQHNGRSVILAVSSDYHQQEISSRLAGMFHATEFLGLVMVEVKLYNNQHYIIEANPRLWGPSQLILDSGMNLFHKFAYDCGLTKAVHSGKYNAGTYYFWKGGYSEDTKAGLPVSYHNFSEEVFLKHEPDLLKTEIYHRHDTLRIHEIENN